MSGVYTYVGHRNTSLGPRLASSFQEIMMCDPDEHVHVYTFAMHMTPASHVFHELN